MSEIYYPGDEIRVPLTVRTPEGTLAAPGACVLTVTPPTGTARVFDSAAGAVARLGLGQYQVRLTVDAPGRWVFSWITTDPLPGIDEFDLVVRQRLSAAASPLNLADLSDLARGTTNGWDELAQRACRDARVSGELLRALGTGASTSAWSAEAVALAEQGIAVLNDQLTRASRYAANYVAARYPAGLSAEQLATSDLSGAVAAIALRRLYGSAVPEEVTKGTAWADRYLSDLASGKVSLGVTDAQEVAVETAYSFSPRAITDDTLRGFG